MSSPQPPFDIIMVWYQNDWGLYGRRNEFIARALLKHKAVRRVLHIEPPLELKYLRSRLRSDALDDNIHTNLKRLNLCGDKGVFLYTPHIVRGMPEKKIALSLRGQVNKAIDLCGMDNILLWLYPPHPFAEFTLNALKDRAALIVSDCVDDHRQYARTDEERVIIEKRYGKIVGASDIAFSVSKIMRDEMARYNSRIFYIPNAIPSDIFSTGKNQIVPSGLAGIQHPIIGYTGALSLRIDSELLGYIAKTKPEWNIVLIGTSPHQDIRALFKLPNVHWLGSMRHDDIDGYIKQFDVCILPHTVNAMTDKMNPLKVYEYLALGKPVISTDVAGIQAFRPDIEIAGNRKNFVDAIEMSLEENSLQRQKKRIDRVRNHTWTARIDEMMQLCLNTSNDKSRRHHKADNKRYYSYDRPEVRACIPDTAKIILDIGCGAGHLGAAIKKNQDCFVLGVEYNPEIANDAKHLLDDVTVGDIEEKAGNLPSDYFDCIILADVLEHLRDPEAVLKKLKRCLKENGKIIASIPNVRHWSVLHPLLEGNWDYENAGILDRTHLRFFTKSSILKLFANTGYAITELKPTTIGDNPAMLRSINSALSNAGVDMSTLADEANHYQYIVCAEKFIQIPQLSSIVILAFNQLKYTKECVESIRKHTPEPYEIIFVDNGSTDGTVKWLRQVVKDHPHCKLIENGNNLGFSKGCNQGIEASSGEYILLLNNDVVVTESWLSGMLECLNSSPDIGIVGPMTNSISGPQKMEQIGYSSVEQLAEYAKEFRAKNRRRRIPLRRIVGFCMLFRRSLVEKIGLLDERFGSGNYEDDDYCLRAAVVGHRNLVAGDVFIHHYGSRSFIGNRVDYGSTLTGNRKIFTDKWSGIDVKSPLGKKILAVNAMDRAREFQHRGQIDKAVVALLELLKNGLKDQDINSLLAEILITAKKFKDALDTLNAAPGEPDAKRLVLAGYCKEGIGLPAKAGELAECALSLDASNAAALNLKGILAYKREDWKAADSFFQEAIKADSCSGEPYTNLGVLKWAAGQHEEALELMERGFILSPTVINTATTYHTAVTAAQVFTRAENIFREAKTLYPLHKRITFLLINILLQQEKHADAMHEIEQAMITFGLDEGILAAALDVRSKIGPLEIDRTVSRNSMLSLCMIVKNEADHLAKCLMSVKPVVQEMIVVDTGSSDKTRDIATAFGAKVFDFPWTGNFDEARNFSLEKASGDWIFILDADEVISRLDHPALTKLVARKGQKRRAYSLVTRNYLSSLHRIGWTANDGKYATEETGNGWFPSTKVRLFPRDSRIRFVNPVHEMVEPSLIRLGISMKDCGIPVHHYGKLNAEKESVKGDEYYLLGKKKLAETGNDLNAIQELAIQAEELNKHDEALDLWQRAIAINPGMTMAYLNMGSIYLKTDRFLEALAASKKAIELAPGMKEAVCNYALSEMYAGNVERSIAVLQDSTGKAHDYSLAQVLLGVACCCGGRKEQGLQWLRKLRTVKFGFADTIHEFAKKLVAARQVDYAISLLDTAVETSNINEDMLRLREECNKLSVSMENPRRDMNRRTIVSGRD